MDGKLIFSGYFRSYALEMVKYAIEYFIACITGPLEDIHKGYRTARCFDPFFVKEKYLVTLRENLQELSSLGLPYLNSS